MEDASEADEPGKCAPARRLPSLLLPWDRFSAWLHCVCVVGFDLELGQAVEVSEGAAEPSSGEARRAEKVLLQQQQCLERGSFFCAWGQAGRQRHAQGETEPLSCRLGLFALLDEE